MKTIEGHDVKIFTDNIEDTALEQIKEQRKAFRDAMAAELEKRLDMMRKRQAYFSVVAEEYESFDEFIRTQKDWLEIFGIELSQDDKSYLSLRIQLDYTDYETYHIINGEDGHLTVSDIIWWQDLYCTNTIMNIQTGESADEEDIPRCY